MKSELRRHYIGIARSVNTRDAELRSATGAELRIAEGMTSRHIQVIIECQAILLTVFAVPRPGVRPWLGADGPHLGVVAFRPVEAFSVGQDLSMQLDRARQVGGQLVGVGEVAARGNGLSVVGAKDTGVIAYGLLV